MKHFRCYLSGNHFIVRTDHGSLTWLKNFKNPEGQLARWFELLFEYDFEIVHRKGRSHANADALSRRPCDKSCKHWEKIELKEKFHSDYNFEKVNVVSLDDSNHSNSDSDSDVNLYAISIEEMKNQQIADPTIKPIIEFKEAREGKPDWSDVSNLSPSTKYYWARWETLYLRSGVLYRKWENFDGKDIAGN